MKKKIFLFSSLVLASSTFGLSVSADETTPTTTPVGDTTLPVPSTDTGTITPAPVDGGATTPVDIGVTTPVDGGATTPVETPVDGGATTPVDDDTTPIDDGGTVPIDGDAEIPIDEGTTTPIETPKVNDPKTSDNGNPETSVDRGTTTANDGNNTTPNESAVTPPRNVNNDPIINPVETPVELATGQTIVGTEKSQVIVQNVDGTQTKVSAESVGGTVNSDGTVTLTDKEGKKQTLPETGSEVSIFLTIFGTFLMWFGISLTKKRQQLYANLSQFSY